MAVKPASGEVLVEERRTRVESTPISKDTGRETLLPIWEFVDSMDDSYMNKCEFTIYRGRAAEKAEDKIWIGKFFERITPEIIQRRWGGGQYNIWLKVPIGDSSKVQLKYNIDQKIDGTPKTESTPSAGPTAMDATSQLIAMFREEMRAMREEMKLARGGDLGMDAVKQAMTLNGQVFSSAMPAVVKTLETVGNHSNGGSSSGMDDITREFMKAAIAKMLNPSDPIEAFAKMASAMGTLGFKMGGGAGGGIGLEIARGLMNALPQLAGHVGGIMDQYRRAEEARLQTAAIMHGKSITVAPGHSSPASPGAAQPPQSNVLEMPAAPAVGAPPTLTQEQQMQAEQIFQLVEAKVVELLMNLELTPEEAANDALTFIDVMDKHLVDELLRHGEGGLRWAFANREILRQVPAGPRLDAFIAEFVKNARKVAVPIPLQPDPNIPPA